jgi:hypothetical protein
VRGDFVIVPGTQGAPGVQTMHADVVPRFQPITLFGVKGGERSVLDHEKCSGE